MHSGQTRFQRRPREEGQPDDGLVSRRRIDQGIVVQQTLQRLEAPGAAAELVHPPALLGGQMLDRMDQKLIPGAEVVEQRTV